MEEQGESEFDDLLDQLTNELALTPACQTDKPLYTEVDAPEGRMHGESAQELMASHTAGVNARRGVDPMVKIVGILTGSLTLVALAALFVFGRGESSAIAAAPSVATAQQGLGDDTAATAFRDASERLDDQRRVAAELAERSHVIRHEAARLQALAEAERAAAVAQKSKKKRKRSRSNSKSASKPLGADFDAL